MKEGDNLYYLCWKDSRTGQVGHGTEPMPEYKARTLARAYIERQDTLEFYKSKMPRLNYWVCPKEKISC